MRTRAAVMEAVNQPLDRPPARDGGTRRRRRRRSTRCEWGLPHRPSTSCRAACRTRHRWCSGTRARSGRSGRAARAAHTDRGHRRAHLGTDVRALLVLLAWRDGPLPRGRGSRCPALQRRRAREPFAGFAGLGTFSTYVTLDEALAVPVRTRAACEALALVGCAVVDRRRRRVDLVRGGRISVVVFGCGGVRAVRRIQGARIVGASEIIGVDPVAMKRDAAIALGATTVVDPGEENPGDVARARTEGRGADVAFEAVGCLSRLAVERGASDATRRDHPHHRGSRSRPSTSRCPRPSCCSAARCSPARCTAAGIPIA